MNYKDPRDYKAQKNKELLDKIGILESSGGVDVDHKPILEGRQAGDTAIGTYGLMPNTIDEFAKRYPSDATEGMASDELEQKAKNDPNFAELLAETIVSHLRDKRGLSEDETAAAWEQGHNLPADKIKLNNPRARKFKVLNKNDKK